MRTVFGVLAVTLSGVAVTMIVLDLSALGWCTAVGAWCCAAVAGGSSERLPRRPDVPPTERPSDV